MIADAEPVDPGRSTRPRNREGLRPAGQLVRHPQPDGDVRSADRVLVRHVVAPALAPNSVIVVLLFNCFSKPRHRLLGACDG